MRDSDIWSHYYRMYLIGEKLLVTLGICPRTFQVMLLVKSQKTVSCILLRKSNGQWTGLYVNVNYTISSDFCSHTWLTTCIGQFVESILETLQNICIQHSIRVFGKYKQGALLEFHVISRTANLLMWTF